MKQSLKISLLSKKIEGGCKIASIMGQLRDWYKKWLSSKHFYLDLSNGEYKKDNSSQMEEIVDWYFDVCLGVNGRHAIYHRWNDYPFLILITFYFYENIFSDLEEVMKKAEK